jgi:hypothetical protein
LEQWIQLSNLVVVETAIGYSQPADFSI